MPLLQFTTGFGSEAANLKVAYDNEMDKHMGGHLPARQEGLQYTETSQALQM